MAILPQDTSIITFVTVNQIKLYGIYDKNLTTLKQVIKTFFDNYECNKKERINIYSDELDTPIHDLDSSLLMNSFNFSKKTTFTLKYKNSNKKLFNKKDAEKRLNEMLQIKDPMQIFCKTSSGQTHTLNVESDFTINDIDLLLEHVSGLPPDCQRLLYYGKQLEGNKALYEYCIQKESTLHIVLTTRAGMIHETSGKNGNFDELESNIFKIESDVDVQQKN